MKQLHSFMLQSCLPEICHFYDSFLLSFCNSIVSTQFTIALLLFYIKDIINVSTEPDLNQRPKDICCIALYSPPLYQLSYRW